MGSNDTSGTSAAMALSAFYLLGITGLDVMTANDASSEARSQVGSPLMWTVFEGCLLPGNYAGYYFIKSSSQHSAVHQNTL